MTEYAVGQSVRTLTEITDEYGRELVPERVQAMVVGFQGPRLVLSWDDENGDTVTALADPWQVYRLTPRAVR